MSKKHAQINVYNDDWERFKQETDNASEEIREFIKNYLQRDDSKEKRVEAINQEIEEKKKEIAKLQKQISNLQGERSTLESEIEQEAKTSKQKREFIEETLRRHYIDNNWTCPGDIPSFWSDEFECSKEDLWEEADKILNKDLEISA